MDLERYSRQTQLKEFGLDAQKKLLNAKVLIVGAGGLGVPVLSYLNAMGIGTLGIIDNDVVSISNLHRRVQGFFYNCETKTPKFKYNLYSYSYFFNQRECTRYYCKLRSCCRCI